MTSRRFFPTTHFSAYAVVCDSVARLARTDRIETALVIVRAAYPGKIQNAVLVTAYNYLDALAGSVYAAQRQAPLILTDGSLPEGTRNYLEAGKPSAAVLFGGKNAVGPGIEQALRELVKAPN